MGSDRNSIPPEINMNTTREKSLDPNSIEARNRSSIKKLVHHQLMGRGLEKKDKDFLDCWSVTCLGVSVALVSFSS